MFQPRAARFTAPDPISGNLFNPQSWNRYGYALNSPLVYRDTTGMLTQGPMPSCGNPAMREELHCGFWDVYNEMNGIGWPILGTPIGFQDPTAGRGRTSSGNSGGQTGSESGGEGGGGTDPPTENPPCVPTTERGFHPAFPMAGAAESAVLAFKEGRMLAAIGHALIAVSDVSLVRSAGSGLMRGAWKTGGHSWSATRRWYGRTRDLAPGTPVHHWLIEQNSAIGKMIPNAIKNQPWNLKAMPSQAFHS